MVGGLEAEEGYSYEHPRLGCVGATLDGTMMAGMFQFFAVEIRA